MLSASAYNLNALILLIAVGFIMYCLYLFGQRQASRCSMTIEDYLFKLARITKKSEYEIFHEAAKQWPVSKLAVENDFKNYLLDHEETPYYVNDFIRKHKNYLDNWTMPPF